MNIILQFLGCAVIAVAVVDSAKGGLAVDLQELARMGNKASLDEVEVRGKELLGKYQSRDEQALIHYQLAMIHAQTGMKQAELGISHCQNARQGHLPPEKTLLMYIYEGDGLRLKQGELPASKQQPYPETRRQATAVYLQGLVESQKSNLPKNKPEFRDRRQSNEEPEGDPKGPEFQNRIALMRKENEEYLQKLKKSLSDEATWENRRILYDQIVGMYVQSPRDDDELRTSASKTLPPDMVATLFERLEAKAARQKQPVPSVASTTPKGDRVDMSSDENKSKSSFWIVALNLIAITTILAILVVRRFRRSR